MNRLYNETSVQNIADAIREKKGYTGKNFFDYESARNINNTTISTYRLFEIGNLTPNALYDLTGFSMTAPTTGYIYLWDTPSYADSSKAFISSPAAAIQADHLSFNANSEGKIYLAIFDTTETIWNENIAYFENAMLRLASITDKTYEPYCRYKIGDMPEEISTISGGGEVPTPTSFNELNEMIIELYDNFYKRAVDYDSWTPYLNTPATLYSPVSGYDWYFIRYRGATYQVLWFNKRYPITFNSTQRQFTCQTWSFRSINVYGLYSGADPFVQSGSGNVAYYISKDFDTINDAIDAIQSNTTTYTSKSASGGFTMDDQLDYSKIYTNMSYINPVDYISPPINKVSNQETIAYIN